MNFSKKITDKFACDIELFTKPRKFSDGIDFIELRSYSNWYRGDHQPSYNFDFSVFNLCVFSLHIYNTDHIEHREDYDWKTDHTRCFSYNEIESLRIKAHDSMRFGVPDACEEWENCTSFDNGIDVSFDIIVDEIVKGLAKDAK